MPAYHAEVIFLGKQSDRDAIAVDLDAVAEEILFSRLVEPVEALVQIDRAVEIALQTLQDPAGRADLTAAYADVVIRVASQRLVAVGAGDRPPLHDHGIDAGVSEPRDQLSQ